MADTEPHIIACYCRAQDEDDRILVLVPLHHGVASDIRAMCEAAAGLIDRGIEIDGIFGTIPGVLVFDTYGYLVGAHRIAAKAMFATVKEARRARFELEEDDEVDDLGWFPVPTIKLAALPPASRFELILAIADATDIVWRITLKHTDQVVETASLMLDDLDEFLDDA